MLRHDLERFDVDPLETGDWLESIAAVYEQGGPARVTYLMEQMRGWVAKRSIVMPTAAVTPSINTIPKSAQPPFPGDRALERRIKNYIRWNAMTMVVKANKHFDGIGGHISTYASVATLFEIGFNHFFRAKTQDGPGDQIFFQGHASPGIYSRAFLEGRLNETHLNNFRRELAKGGGLSSYPHPWLMPDFWEFPTVSMGLGPITSIYQARFNEYLTDRGIANLKDRRVWAFLGDGEMDEPESLASITLATREELGNLIWVINCNLQRLDGPVRGNGSVVQELEGVFRGAGWNVIKCLWGSDWDPLFEQDTEGVLVDTMSQIVDGQWQRYSAEPGAYARQHFFGRDPRLLKMVENMSDEKLQTLRLGGHDPEKVYAAYKSATETVGRPTVILARTVKGYGLGEAGEGKNITHQQKKLNEEALQHFRDRFDIPVTDEQLKDPPFLRFNEKSDEFQYLMSRRKALGGSVPARKVTSTPIAAPKLSAFDEFTKGSSGNKASTTMAFTRMLNRLMHDPTIGKLIVPIVPDEARTFGMEALFNTYGIYAHAGQLYEPVDAHLLMKYAERQNGQILEEGITEAGAMASWTAAGTAYCTHGINTIPFFTFYSMFGFQRVGDSIWAAADMRVKGFLMGATAGRTTLNGEGLQHEDGHSQMLAANVPNCVSYDPAYAYELSVIVQNGIERMYEKRDDVFFYITIYNENYEQPPLPAGVNEGIIRGMYKVRPAESPGKMPRLHLFGSGPLLNEALRAQQILREKYSVAADVWSITSYNELYRDCLSTDRVNRLNPAKPAVKSYFAKCLEKEAWPIVATSDFVKALPMRLAAWAPAGLTALGTDGFGRSETREALRRFFETDAEHVAFSALAELSRRNQFDAAKLAAAAGDLGINTVAGEPSRA